MYTVHLIVVQCVGDLFLVFLFACMILALYCMGGFEPYASRNLNVKDNRLNSFVLFYFALLLFHLILFVLGSNPGLSKHCGTEDSSPQLKQVLFLRQNYAI